MPLESPAAQAQGSRSEEPENGAGGESATVLVVDDEPLARQMLTDLLESQGFHVIGIGRGEEVFDWLDRVDLVLLDAMLPGRDGWDICREIKEDHASLVPIVMVTARTAPDDVVRTFSAGADDYIAKPFHVAELTARIVSRLRVHRAELALHAANRQLRELADQNYELYEQARHDAEERAELLRELDHRVRNNLSVILGLVSIERNRRPPRDTPVALASLENRLRSFLLVHEALRHHKYAGVPARDIVERLSQRLRNNMDLDGRVRLEISGEPILLDEREGFALALTLNELVSNALQHAFPGQRSGNIAIRLSQPDSEFRLEVIDDGVGALAAADGEVHGSGRSIVEALVRGELGGRVELLPAARGTHVLVSFPRGSSRQYVAR